MAARGVVLDRNGNPVDDDDGVLRDGQRLVVPVEFMDAEVAEVIANLKRRNLPKRAIVRDAANPYAISDVQRQRVADAYSGLKARVGAGMHRHRRSPPGDEVADGDGLVAYERMKRKLAQGPRARKAKKPVEHHGWPVHRGWPA